MSKKKVYILIQEGGSSSELYIHAHSTAEEAEQDRIDCSNDGGYATSPVMEVSAALADTDGFYDALEEVLRNVANLEVVETEDTNEEED